MRAPLIRAHHILPYSIILMRIGMFGKRALLSVGLGLMILSSIGSTGFVRQWQMIITSTCLKFILWDLQHFTQVGYTEGLSDTPMLSPEAGRASLYSHPWLGSGFADLKNEMNGWHLDHASFMREYEQPLPSFEFLLHGAATGILLAILFSVVVLLPFFLPSHLKSMAWISFHAIAVVGFMYEIGLETQYGIFIYGFLGYLAWLFMDNPGQPGWKNILKTEESEAS